MIDDVAAGLVKSRANKKDNQDIKPGHKSSQPKEAIQSSIHYCHPVRLYLLIFFLVISWVGMITFLETFLPVSKR